MKSFRDLEAYKVSKQIAKFIYGISENFPDKEKFGLSNQIRRASISIISNLAEGCGRSSAKDTIHFFYISRGSACEVESQADVACDFGYITPAQFEKALELLDQYKRLLHGLISRYQNL